MTAAAELRELARLITSGLGQGVSTADFRAARRGDESIGYYIAEAIQNAGYQKHAACSPQRLPDAQ